VRRLPPARKNRLIACLLLIAAGWGLPGGVQAKAATAKPAHGPSPRIASAAVLSGDAAAGERLYQACMGCHSLGENDVGPRHRGVVGRKAGTVPDYVYSMALRRSGLVWTSANLDKWLTNPQKLVPGAKMFFSVAKPKDRADIIAYLAQQN
jgi:cytochrome c